MQMRLLLPRKEMRFKSYKPNIVSPHTSVSKLSIGSRNVSVVLPGAFHHHHENHLAVVVLDKSESRCYADCGHFD